MRTSIYLTLFAAVVAIAAPVDQRFPPGRPNTPRQPQRPSPGRPRPVRPTPAPAPATPAPAPATPAPAPADPAPAPADPPTTTPVEPADPTTSNPAESSAPADGGSGDCLAGATQPTAPTALPAPSGALLMVALGQGTQNYTCTTGATPVGTLVGAVATLHDISCNTASPSTSGPVVGNHFFTAAGVPEFDVGSLGNTLLGKTGTSNSPNPAADVAWLQLTSTTGTTGNVKQIYRLETSGGVAKCDGTQTEVQIPYTAQYWFYA